MYAAAPAKCTPCLRVFAETLFVEDEEVRTAMLRLDFEYQGRRVRSSDPRFAGRDRDRVLRVQLGVDVDRAVVTVPDEFDRWRERRRNRSITHGAASLPTRSHSLAATLMGKPLGWPMTCTAWPLGIVPARRTLAT